MTTIKYEVDGKTIELEVEDSFASAYLEVETESKRNEWKHEKRAKRHHCSLEAITEGGYQIASDDESASEMVEDAEQKAALRQAIRELLPEQQELIRRIYFGGETETSIAEELGVTQSAIAHRVARALAQLKKYLKNF